ncbi:uncharacterized protein LOC135926868 [Gordionus sp. m RMFG-2023]|uniref:uncharacterized protein LOC135926868 n=1 Tax=Gordionus sp. m RMFG-2023 TaxID=3053472 RepID=UPI0031FBE907
MTGNENSGKTGTLTGFTIAEGVHQGSALSPLLFITIFADIVILAESKDEMKELIVSWINILEKHGLKVNRKKTEYIVIGEDKTESIDINEWHIPAIENCKYLDSTIQNGTIEKEIKSKINQGCSETWPTKESDERSLQTMEMRMLRMIAGVTRNKMQSTRILGSLMVLAIKTKIMVNRLRWYGYTMRKPMNYIGNKVESLEVIGKRKRGRPKLLGP